MSSGLLACRPELDRCWEQLRRGDELVITRLLRLARSVRHLTEVVAELDTRSPAARLLFHVLGPVDEFTADLISEGTHGGLAAARALAAAAAGPP